MSGHQQLSCDEHPDDREGSVVFIKSVQHEQVTVSKYSFIYKHIIVLYCDTVIPLVTAKSYVFSSL